MNDYAQNAHYDDYVSSQYEEEEHVDTEGPLFLSQDPDIDLDDPKIASLPRILLTGPRRGGKTSIQVRAWTVGVFVVIFDMLSLRKSLHNYSC